ncbi:MAG: glutamine synthetase family protein [Atopobiaceae bacterium]|jgi:glutamine synthetase|nr:glutamine synthetase family protein [Atopobiaceae bacterium]MCH4179827.1 glutamine synthetase family protein [Atopobiaceae bacterium]MCH4213578.1 glutamine synthetase family protein [Atopobiaceae bacterium]MCH4230035.1 glutamine synthetase family protein [Atopobiaceae bacterium]MCH4276226.1 glutamine synthetase family protein [Atopobiaceae bacterium]
MTNEQNIDFVLRTVEERDIRFVRLWFTDVLGNLKSFSISPEDLEEAFEEGIGFDGSSVDGFAPQEESDMLAFPDPDTFQILPWRPEESGVARIFCDIKTPACEPFAGDPRACLERVFRAADEQGYISVVGPELEYFYFADDHLAKPLDGAGYFDLTPTDSARDLRRDTVLTLEQMSIPVEYSYHDIAPSQNGLSLRHAEALSSADNIMTSRLVVKQVAFSHDMFASFMPKPFADAAGSALFMHQSLFDHEGNNVFWGEDTEDGSHLSDVARHYVAGLLAYAPEYALVTNPTVNSYKRLVDNGEVPCYTTWGRRNRSALVRVPLYKPGKQASCRVELRLPDASCNPYLAMAVTLAAGMRGIQDGLELPDECPGSDPSVVDATRLPGNLGEAVEAFSASSLMRETLGDHIFDFLVEHKGEEWDEFSSTVTEWERGRSYAGF